MGCEDMSDIPMFVRVASFHTHNGIEIHLRRDPGVFRQYPSTSKVAGYNREARDAALVAQSGDKSQWLTRWKYQTAGARFKA